MAATFSSISRRIDSISEWVGKVSSFIMLAIMVIVAWDVTARYVFMSPLLWGTEMGNILFGAYFLMGGAYTLRFRAHVNVDIVKSHLSSRTNTILDIVGFAFFLFFAVIMIWQSADMAWDSLMVREKSASAWGAPIYLVKIFIPIGVCLLLIQGFANLFSTIQTLTRRGERN